ncbi:LuxR C-terminal-related transcriptional regulator [Streptomyces sp. NPDC054770]
MAGTGCPARGPRPASSADYGQDTGLTPRERDIAQPAASALTNKRIAEPFFTSHRTVGAHPWQVCPELGTTSRGALRNALSARDSDGDH